MTVNREEMLLKEYEKSLIMRDKYEEMIINPKEGVDIKFVMTSITYYRTSVERLSSSLFKESGNVQTEAISRKS